MKGIELYPYDKLWGFGDNARMIVSRATGRCLGYVAEVEGQLKFFFEELISFQNLQSIVKRISREQSPEGSQGKNRED